MNKIKIEIYKDVLRDVSANFDGAKDFIKTKLEEIYDRNKIFVEKVILFCLKGLCF